MLISRLTVRRVCWILLFEFNFEGEVFEFFKVVFDGVEFASDGAVAPVEEHELGVDAFNDVFDVKGGLVVAFDAAVDSFPDEFAGEVGECGEVCVVVHADFLGRRHVACVEVV